MANLTITSNSIPSMSAWVSINIYWPGDIDYNRKCITLFLNEKRHNTKISYARNLVEHFPKLFSKVQFFTEEGIEKVSLIINEEFNISFK